MDEIVCAKTYDNIQAAEVARAVLESEGIQATIFRDDYAGLYPGMFTSTGHRLMVNGADLAQAREILENAATE
jgi:hypothetical protein